MEDKYEDDKWQWQISFYPFFAYQQTWIYCAHLYYTSRESILAVNIQFGDNSVSLIGPLTQKSG